jgi:hypothetical protein
MQDMIARGLDLLVAAALFAGQAAIALGGLHSLAA